MRAGRRPHGIGHSYGSGVTACAPARPAGTRHTSAAPAGRARRSGLSAAFEQPAYPESPRLSAAKPAVERSLEGLRPSLAAPGPSPFTGEGLGRG